jgi:hypothetical protein
MKISVAAAPVFAEFGGRQDLLLAVALDLKRDKPGIRVGSIAGHVRRHADQASGVGRSVLHMRRFDPNRRVKQTLNCAYQLS